MTRTSNLPRLMCLVCVLLVATAANAQQPPTLLYVDVENWVGYAQDVTDQSKVATSAGPLVAAPSLNFSQWVTLADISAVNSAPAKGVLVLSSQNVRLSPTPSPGMSIGDVVRQGHAHFSWEFLQPDGTPIGSIYCVALSGGNPAPGSPLASAQGNGVIVGGTGAFLGAGGTINSIKSSMRTASQGEDPSMRRTNGGGAGRFVLQIIPMFRPEIIATSGGAAIVHSGDFSPVTTAKPAKAGEILTLFAKGLGPTRPGVDPGQPFPATGSQVVNSPVEVLVNGASVQALYAGGYPGAIDGYQVNFRLPDSIAPGVGAIALRVAWIGGAEVQIPVQ